MTFAINVAPFLYLSLSLFLSLLLPQNHKKRPNNAGLWQHKNLNVKCSNHSSLE